MKVSIYESVVPQYLSKDILHRPLWFFFSFFLTVSQSFITDIEVAAALESQGYLS